MSVPKETIRISWGDGHEEEVIIPDWSGMPGGKASIYRDNPCDLSMYDENEAVEVGGKEEK